MTNPVSITKEKFLVEELETLFAVESVNYYKKLITEWETTSIDPMEYDKMLSGKIYWQFNKLIYDKIKPLTNFEVTRYFALSLAQFKTHTPENRIENFTKIYQQEYWSPTKVIFNKDANELHCICHIWLFYTNHFNQFRLATEHAQEDFKSGVLGIVPPNSHVTDSNPKHINEENFLIYTKLLLVNSLHAMPPLAYKKQLSDGLRRIKHEIIGNLFILMKDDRKPYLNSIFHSLSDFKKTNYTTQLDIDKCLQKHNIQIPLAEIVENENKNLFEILSSIPRQVNGKFTLEYNEQWHEIQLLYFKFYFSNSLIRIHRFLAEQLEELNPSTYIAEIEKHRLKTNLSVPQLALLFKMLSDLKPNIFNINSEAELIRFISANFETKQSKEEGISTDKLRILFNQPDSKAADFWEKHYYTLLAETKKFK